MRGRSKLTAKVVVLATVVLIIVACVSSIPGGTCYFHVESGEFTSIILRQEESHQVKEVAINDPETVETILEYLNRFAYSYRAPFFNGPTVTLVLDGKENIQYYYLSPYGVVNQQEHFVYNSDQAYFQPLFDLLKETQ